MTKTLEEGKRWLAQAEAERFYIVCFLAQRSAEKAIKTYLYGREERVVVYAVTILLKRVGGVFMRTGIVLIGEFGYSQD